MTADNMFVWIAILFLIVMGILWILCRREITYDRKQREAAVIENSERLAAIEAYLNSLALSLEPEDKALIFKLKNRWKLIYRHLPAASIPHPQLFRACADRDAIEVELMDRGIYLEYPNG